MFKNLLARYLRWGVNASKYWSSYSNLLPYDDEFYFTISDALFVGNQSDGDDYWSLYNEFQGLYPDNLLVFVNETFDTYWKKAREQPTESIYTTAPIENLLSVLLNNSVAESVDFVDDLLDNIGFFGCILHPQEPCMASLQLLK